VVAGEWQHRIRDQKASGLSVRKWCADNQIQESRYYYWLKALRNEELVLGGTAGVFAELQAPGGSQETTFSAAAGICAVLRGTGLCLEIHNGADSRTLEATLKALGMVHP
jgi:hypothetical protein